MRLELELKTDGNVLLDGELFVGSPVLESKLGELTQQIPPPDLRVKQSNDSVGADVLEQCQTLLGKFGYRTILLIEIHEYEAVPVYGKVWRLN